MLACFTKKQCELPTLVGMGCPLSVCTCPCLPKAAALGTGQGSYKGASSEWIILLNALIPNWCPKIHRTLSWKPSPQMNPPSGASPNTPTSTSSGSYSSKEFLLSEPPCSLLNTWCYLFSALSFKRGFRLKPLCMFSGQGEASPPSESRGSPRRYSLGGQCHVGLETTQQDLSHGGVGGAGKDGVLGMHTWKGVVGLQTRRS